MPTNTLAEDDVLVLQRIVKPSGSDLSTRSTAIVRSIQILNPNIQTKGFKESVINSIFDDGVDYDYPSRVYSAKLRQRLERRFGKQATRKLLCKHCEILHDWLYRDCKFIPDAYLIDPNKKTIVCYEVEDSNPLKFNAILKYANAWWTLDEIYWDLHLIAYDIFGNARIIALPQSEFFAKNLA